MKRKLLFAIVALLCSVGASAQDPGDDMTSHITNPTFTDNADGWTIDGQARYFNGKGFDGTTNFIELTNWGSSWDATISQAVTVPNGYYLVQAAAQMSGNSELWMKLVANGAESFFSRNGDTNGNILANGTETTIGSGVAGWRYTRVIAKVTDGNLAISCVGHSDVKERWANFDAVTLTYLGTEFAPNTDVTEFISNWDFWGCFNDSFNGWTITKDGGNSWVHGNTAVEHWSGDHALNFDFYQTVTGLPEGRYTLSASMWNTQGTPNGNSGVYATNSSSVTVFAGVTEDCDDNNLHTYTTNGIFVNDGELRVGVKNNGARSTNWFGVDWINMTYVGKVVADYAVELPDGGAMTADTWYYFDIAVADDHYTATADALGDIICVTDGNTLTSAAVGTVTLTAADNSLSVRRYYVKSSSDNHLVIGVASYTYVVGEGTTSIADGVYANNSLSTFTVTFSEATSNDPGATFAILNGSAKASLKKGGVQQAEGTLSLAGKVLTATFNATLDLSSAYTIEIAAGVVGYEGHETNAAISTSFNTGIIANGVYYFKRNDTDAYLTRGGNYGTENVTDKFGISFEAAIQNDGAYTLKNIDQSLVDNTTKYLNEQYTDQTGAYEWTIEATEGGYVLKKSSGQYVTTAEEGTWHYNYMTNAADKASAIVWTLLSKSEYAAALTARKNAEAAAIATAAGRSETTEAALISALASDYGETDVTSSLTNASLASNADGWTAVSYNGQRRNQSEEVDVIRFNGGAEVWNYIGGAKQTISSLPEGIYKVTVKSVWRLADATSATRAGSEANVTAWMYATSNGVTDYTQLKSWYDHQVANNAALHASTDDEYVNTVYVYVEEGQDLTIGVASPSWCGVPWMPFYDFTLSYYEAKATQTEKDNLAAAITAAEAKPLGFKTSEYAPYNNVAALEALAAAKAIDANTASGTAVVAATTDLTGAIWTANVAEVNAFYDGDFSIQAPKNDGGSGTAVTGWTANSSIRTLVKSATEGAALYIATEGHSGMYVWSGANATYGETTGYTVPLHANQVYTLSYKRGSWNADGSSTYGSVSITGPEETTIPMVGESLYAYKYETTGVELAQQSFYFVAPVDGNYVFVFGNSGNTVFTDIQLYSVDSNTLTLSQSTKYAAGTYPNVILDGRTFSADKWNTLCVPFAFDKDGFAEVKELSSITVTGDHVRMAFADASTIVAGKPYLVKAKSNGDELTATNVSVVAGVQESSATANDYTVNYVGTYDGVALTDANSNAWVVSNNQLWNVNSDVTVGAYRAYFTVTTPAPVKALFFNFDDADAIQAIDNGQLTIDNGQIFNLAGQRLSKMQKGINIVNGKKVLVK